MIRQEGSRLVRITAQGSIDDRLVFVGDMPAGKRLLDGKTPISVQLVSQLVAECNERARAALGNQGAMKDPVQPLPFRIVLELLGIERPRRSA